MPDDLLTTAQLAELTGLRAGTLRMWESRHGFPVPRQLPGGHHRYSQADVGAVRRVLRDRADGLSLAAAIERARTPSPSRSIFATLRAQRPDLQRQAVSKRALLALTRAIEDEHLAHAQRGIVIGSFQSEPHYRASEPRWRELARGARIAIALANFAQLHEPPTGPVEVPLHEIPELRREWTVIVCAPSGGACLAAWEPPTPGSTPDARRMFEAIWSFEPASVQAALRAAHAVIAGAAPTVADRLAAELAQPAASPPSDLRFGSDLSVRAFGYLAAEIERGSV